MDLTGRASLPPRAGRAPVANAPVQQWYLKAESEQYIRSRGRWFIIGGLVTAALTMVLAIVWHKGFHEDMPLAFVLPIYGLAFGALTIGCMEYLTRSTRAANERTLAAVEAIADNQQLLVGLMDEELQQKFYKGAAWNVQNTMTGTEDARPLPSNLTPFRRASKQRSNG